MSRLSEHFDSEEFRCHDGTELPDELRPNAVRLCTEVLEPIRARWGGPLVILSGYRTPEHNAALAQVSKDVAKASRHCLGMAADIRPVDIRSVPSLRNLVVSMAADGSLPALGGLGDYPSWVHVDIWKAADGHLRRWMGTGVGTETRGEL